MGSPRSSAFTLIELLTVTAIIAVLAALLLPAISLIRESARLSNCLSNQRQLILGLQAYATDHGNYPFYWFSGSTCNPALYKPGYVVSRDSTGGSSMHQWMLPALEEADYIVQAVGYCPNRSRLVEPFAARMDGDWAKSPDNPNRGNWPDVVRAQGNTGDYIYRGPGTSAHFWPWTKRVKSDFPDLSLGGGSFTMGVDIRNRTYKAGGVAYTVSTTQPATFSGKTQPLVGCPKIWNVPATTIRKSLHRKTDTPMGYTDGHVEVDEMTW